MYHPKDKSRLHQFGAKFGPEYSMDMHCMLEEFGKGDTMVADLGKLGNLGAPKNNARKLNAKEVIMLENCDNLVFPVADGRVKLFEGYLVLRTST